MPRRFHWHPAADPKILEPWFPQLDTLKRNPYKSNGQRYVFRVISQEGLCYYVKLEEKKGLLSRLRNWFSPKVRSEFESGRLLEKLNIPAVRYAAWGTSGSTGILVSRALEGYVPLHQFWHESAVGSPELRERILREFCALVTAFARHGLHHPDFHTGNVLVDPKTLKLVLVDLYGICRAKRPDPAELLLGFADLRGRTVPAALLQEFLQEAAFPEAEKHLQNAFFRAEERILHEWPRRQKQILSGESKFASHPSPEKWIRKSVWYAPCALPEERTAEILPASAGTKLWLDSFLQQLLRRPLEKIPLTFETIRPDSVRIEWIREGKNASFYGF